MEVLLGEIALKVAVGELYKGVKGLIKNYVEFEPVLEDIAHTLAALEPLISKIEDQNTELNLPVQKKVTENLRKEIEKGQKLVKEYSEVGPSLLGCLKKTTRYTDHRLRKLDVSLRRQLEILKAQEVLVVNETCNLVILIAEELKIIPKDRHPKYRNSLVCDQIKVKDALSPTQMDVPPKVDLAKHVPLISNVHDKVLIKASCSPVDLVGEAAGGVLFSVLYDTVKELMMNKRMMLPLLKSIKSTLDSARPVIHQIAQLNEELDLPKEEVENVTLQIDEGMVLLTKFSKVQVWNTFKMYKYANKLLYWDESLQRQLGILNVQGIIDVKEYLVSIRKTNKVVTEVEMPNINLEEGFKQIATIIHALGKIKTSSFLMDSKGFKELISNFVMYETRLKNIISTLDAFELLIQQIAQISEEMDLPREEVQNVRVQVEEGLELVHKLSKAHKWSIYRKYKYMKNLIEWEQSIQRQLARYTLRAGNKKCEEVLVFLFHEENKRGGQPN